MVATTGNCACAPWHRSILLVHFFRTPRSLSELRARVEGDGGICWDESFYLIAQICVEFVISLKMKVSKDLSTKLEFGGHFQNWDARRIICPQQI